MFGSTLLLHLQLSFRQLNDTRSLLGELQGDVRSSCRHGGACRDSDDDGSGVPSLMLDRGACVGEIRWMCLVLKL